MATEAQEPADPATDDLSKPLGKKKPKRKAFVVPPWIVSRSIAGVLGFCVLVLAGWILFIDEPYGGEPMTIVSADTRASPQSGKPGEGAKPGETAKPGTPSADGKEKPGDGQTVTISSVAELGTQAPGRRLLDDSDQERWMKLIQDRKLKID